MLLEYAGLKTIVKRFHWKIMLLKLLAPYNTKYENLNLTLPACFQVPTFSKSPGQIPVYAPASIPCFYPTLQ